MPACLEATYRLVLSPESDYFYSARLVIALMRSIQNTGVPGSANLLKLISVANQSSSDSGWLVEVERWTAQHSEKLITNKETCYTTHRAMQLMSGFEGDVGMRKVIGNAVPTDYIVRDMHVQLPESRNYAFPATPQ